MSPQLSVALCTRNCAPYLPAQLASLLAQTRLPDELVVGDEASTDGTWEILERFAAAAPFPVRLIRNAQPLGVAANFTQVVAACRGELIALCDHDDIWAATRLERSVAAFDDATVTLAFSDARLITADGIPYGALWATLGVDGPALARLAPPQLFAALLARRAVTGGTMTLRASTAQWALPIPSGWYQDEWLAQLAPLRGRAVAIAEPLMQYRQHPGNAVGAQPDGLWPRLRRARDGAHRRRLEAQRAQLQLLATALQGKAELPEWALPMVTERLAHVEGRLAVQGGPLARTRALWRELASGRYAQDSHGYWSALQDLVG